MSQRRNAQRQRQLLSDFPANQGEQYDHTIATAANPYNAAKYPVILATAGAGQIIQLPTAAANPFKVYYVKKVDAGVGAVTIQGAGADTLDGAVNIVLTNQYDSTTIVSDGVATWHLLAPAGWGGGGAWKEYRTLVIAANDSTAHGKLSADYVCDGVNDEVEINTALSVATASGHRGVTLLEGTFHIAATIDQMLSNTILEGQGDATILRVVDSHDANLRVLDISGVDDVAIERLRIDGNRANQSAGWMPLIWLNTVNNALITNVSIVNARSIGIEGNAALTNSRILGNFFRNNANTGSIFLYQSPNNIIEGNVVEAEAGNFGIYLYDSCDYCAVDGNMVEAGSIYLYDNCDYCTVDGNTLDGGPIMLYDCNHCSVGDNAIDGGSHGIDVEGGVGVAITGNAISSCSIVGIWTDMGTAYPIGFTITGNTIYNVAGWGMSISAYQTTISGNACVDNGGGGIEVTYSDRVIVGDNICIGGAWPIYFYDSYRSVIKGNILYKGTWSGLFIRDATDTLIADNYFEGNSITDGTLPHIQLVADVDDCKFSDNVFREGSEANAPDWCIDIQNANCDDNMILNNDFRGGATVGSINDGGTGTQIIDTFTDAGVFRVWVKSGDPVFVWTINAIDEWYAGVDDSDGDKFQIGTGSAPGANVAVEINSDRDTTIKQFLGFDAPTELTIAAGVVTAVKTYHTVDTQNDDPADDLDTINGGEDGQILIIRPIDAARTVTAKDGAGNLALAGDFAMDDSSDTLTLIYDATLTEWLELSRSNNG